MAAFQINDFDKFAFDFEELAKMPDTVIEDMLTAEGKVIRDGQEKTAKSMLQGPFNKGAVSRAAKLGKLKKTANERSVYITFEGSQHGARVAEIAFINEFGKQGQIARPFIQTANEMYADKAVEAAEKIYNEYLTKKGF